MISTLHSLDILFNRFDELSQCHSRLQDEFETKFQNQINPLKSIERTREEQQRTNERIQLKTENDDEQLNSIGILGDFHRRVIKSRYFHRPPSYLSNPSFSSRSSSTLNETSSLPKIIIVTKQSMPIKRSDRRPVTVFCMDTVNRLSKPKQYNRLPALNGYLRRRQQRAKPCELQKKEAGKRPVLPSKKKKFVSKMKKK